MRCTGCSEVVKPIVVFDIDGTIADYHYQLQRFAVSYWALASWKLETAWAGDGDYEDFLGINRDQYREMKLAFRQGGQKRMMPPIMDGIKLYRHVMNFIEVGPPGHPDWVRGEGLDVELWFATHRPYRRLDNIDPDTRWWLDRYSFKYDKLLFGEDKYGELCQQVDPGRIIVFEDLPEMCDRADELGLPVRQVARPHNMHPSQNRWHRGTLEQLTYWYDQMAKAWQDDRSNDG
jgi:hypothetical protein